MVGVPHQQPAVACARIVNLLENVAGEGMIRFGCYADRGFHRLNRPGASLRVEGRSQHEGQNEKCSCRPAFRLHILALTQILNQQICFIASCC
jgi:hypothetical protein